MPSPERQGPVSGLADKCLTVQDQPGLNIIGVGAASQVYKVDDDIVLKTCRIYEPPSGKATSDAQEDYASETIFHAGFLKDERVILRLLSERPHPNIVEVIDTNHPEGIYLRKYRQLSDVTPASQSDRILWYQNILRALLHIHTLGIAHADIRKDNILFDSSGDALLSDFGACCPFGYRNPALPFMDNGPSKTVSDATDRVAMASMIYSLGTGVKPELSTDDDVLVLPTIKTGNRKLDSLIKDAWQGRFHSTADMLKRVERLRKGQDCRESIQCTKSKADLRERVSAWRQARVRQHGKVPVP